MKKIILAISLSILGWTAPLSAEVMTYQGRLKESNIPVNANRFFNFAFCDSDTAGNCLPTTSGIQSFSVQNGLFKSTFTVPASVLGGADLYLRVSVGPASVSVQDLLPRERLTYVPYSVFASSAGFASALSVGSGIGVIASTNVIVLGGLTVSDFGIQPSTTAAIQGYAILTDKTPGGEDIRVGVSGRVVSNSGDLSDIMAGGNFEAEVPAGMKGTGIGLRAATHNGGSGKMAVGILVDSLENSGIITETYGIRISTLTQGTQTNKPYALYSEDRNARTYFAGNVGISSVPAYALVVSSASGDVLWVSSYAVHGIKFAGDGSGLTGVTGASGTDSTKVLKTGDAMTGQLTLYGSTLTVEGNEFSVGGSTFVVKEGYVGIGINAPVSPLNIYGNTPEIRLATPNTTNDLASGFVVGISNINGDARLWNYEGSPIDFGTSNTSRMFITQGGNVGIGTGSNPDQKLTVNGNISQTGVLISSGAGNNYFAGNVGISTGAPQARLDVLAGGSAQTDMAQLWRNSGGAIVSSVSATGVLMATRFVGDGSGITGLGSASDASIATSLAGGALGELPYQSNLNTTAMLAVGSEGELLQSGGNGAPSWTNSPAIFGANISGVGAATLTGGPLPGNVIASSIAVASVYEAAFRDPKVNRAGDMMYGSLDIQGARLKIIADTNANAYSFAAGTGTEASHLYVSTGGNVGIGTTAPWSKLTVDGDVSLIGSVSTIYMGSDSASWQADSASMIWLNGSNGGGYTFKRASSGAPILYMEDAGNIGISTGAPQARLDVLSAGSTQADMAQIWRNSGGTIVSSVSATGVMMASRFVGDGSGITGLASATNVTGIVAIANGGTGATNSDEARSNLGAVNIAGDNMTGQLTNTSSVTITGNGAEGYGLHVSSNVSLAGALYSANGNIGIGTTGPLAQLHIYGNASSENIRIENSSSNNASIIFRGIYGGFLGEVAAASGLLLRVPSNSPIAFQTGAAEKARVNSDGRFGIGTAAPDQLLTVAGNISQTGVLISSGTGDNYFAGNVGISTGAPQARLDVLAGGSAQTDMAQLWRNSGGAIVSSVSATGVLMATRFVGDGSGITGLGSASDASIATSLAGGALGELPYQSNLNTTAMLAVGSEGELLQSGGNGAPSWTNSPTISGGNITGITPASLAVGTLPNDVIASSIAVNSVYDSAMVNPKVDRAGDYMTGSLYITGGQLRVAGNTVSNSYSLAVGTGNVAAYLYVSTTGYVGVGTNVPATRLEVLASGPVNTALFNNSSANSNSIALQSLAGSDQVTSVSFESYSTGQAALRSKGAIRMEKGGHFVFQTSNDGNAMGAERMRIEATGNVGISTGAPQARLDVLAAGSAQTDMAQIWRDSAGTVVSSVSATGAMTAVKFVGDGSGLTGVSAGTYTGTLAVANGGTNAGTAAAARSNLGALGIAGDTMTGQLTNTSSVTITGNGGGAYGLQVSSNVSLAGALYTANGKVGIGTPSPAGLFQVGGGSLTVLANGYVGIGSTSPSVNLQVVGPTTGVASAVIILSGDDSAQAWTGALRLQHKSDTVIAAGSSVGITFEPLASTGSNFTGVAAIKGVRENATASNQNTALTFWTRTGASNIVTDSEKMKITSSGNVGISTGMPQARLDVLAGGSAQTDMAQIWRNSAGTVISSVSATGVMKAVKFVGDGSGLTGLGSASSVANGVYDNVSYSDPVWITSLATSKINLSTVTTALAGKLDNTAAASANIASAIVARDASGNFAAGQITAGLLAGVSGSRLVMTSTTTGSNNSAIKITPLVTATAANDTLVAVTINPAFNDAANIGVRHVALAIPGGRVSIGTGEAYGQLTLAAASSDAELVALRTDVGAQGYAISVGKERGPGGLVQLDDELMAIRFLGQDNNADVDSQGYSTAGIIRGVVDGVVTYAGAYDMPGRIEFLTTPDGSGTPVERMVIKSDGNVGIGTSGPAAKLEIYSPNTVPFMVIRNTSIADKKVVRIFQDANHGLLDVFDSAEALAIRLNANPASPSYINAGNVGIGVTAPSTKLDVAGGIATSNMIYSSGTGTNYFAGNVGISTGAPQARLDVLAAGSAQTDMAQIWRDSAGTVISSVSATGVMKAVKFVGDGSGLTGVIAAGAVQKAGDAMLGALDMSGYLIMGVSTITMQSGSIAIVPPGTGGSNAGYGISIGSNAYDNYGNGVGVGYSAYSNSSQGVGVGNYAYNNSSYGVGVGNSASNNYSSGVGVGSGASSNYSDGVGVGNGASGNYNIGVGVGAGASNNFNNGVAVGRSASGNSNYAVGIGAYSQNNGTYGAALGAYSYANSSGTALGANARATAPNSVAIGNGTVNNSTGTASFGVYSINTSAAVNAAYYQVNGSTVLAISSDNSSISAGVGAGNPNSGVNNSFIGAYAGFYNSAGWNNSFLGYETGYNNTTGINNSFIGHDAGHANTAGSENSFFGQLTGADNITGEKNSFFGSYAGRYTQAGSANAIFGNESGGYNGGVAGGSFSSSTIMGYQAGYKLTGGSADNIFLGYQAGYNVTTGTGNIVIGYDKGTSAPTASNELNIGGLIVGNMAASSVTINGVVSAARYQINGSTMVAILPGVGSIAYGVNAGTSNITGGDYNVFIGNNAGASNTTGVQNTANGSYALRSNTTGVNNTANGSFALNNNTTGGYNTANGNQALYVNTTGGYNTANGSEALYANTFGVQNTANGSYALRSNTTGGGNTANGYGALNSNTIGNANTANGFQALYLNTTGIQNTANGYSALNSNKTGSNNTANGFAALYYNQTGSANSITGYKAGFGAGSSSFSSSTLMGYQAGLGLTTGSDNIFMGFMAGYNVTTGTGNIVIGYNKITSAITANNELNIGGVLYGDLSAKTIGISTRVPQAALDIVSTGTAANVYAQIWRSGDGVIVASITALGTFYGIAGAGDNLGNHTATQQLNMGNFAIWSSSSVSAANYQINGSTVLAILPGTFSLGVGVNAGKYSTGMNNSFVGYEAGLGNGTGNNNSFFGANAGRSNSGSSNSFFGANAGYYDTAGVGNSFMGHQAGFYNSVGVDNSFIGDLAGYNNTLGTNNTIMGSKSGYKNSTGVKNSFLGFAAGFNNQTGSANTIFGNEAAYGAIGQSFSSSTIMGYMAGNKITTGNDNIFMGFQAGYNVTTGTGNIVIGYAEDTSAIGANNELNIGGVIYGNLATGNVGIGNPTPGATLDVAGNISQTGVLISSGTGSNYFAGSVGIGIPGPLTKLDVYGASQIPSIPSPASSGILRIGVSNSIALDIGIYAVAPYPTWLQAGYNGTPYPITLNPLGGNVGIGTTSPGNILTIQLGSATDPIADAWTVYSSRRWKTNIRPLTGALDKVKALEGVYFDWKTGGKHDLGMIAEEVGKVVPELVVYEENGVDARSVDYARLTAVLVEAVKEQQKEIEELKLKVMELKKRNE